MPPLITSSIEAVASSDFVGTGGTPLQAQRAPFTIAAGGTNEVQQVSQGGTWTAGTFTLTFGAATTAAIAFNATAAQVQSALEALSTIGVGNVSCTGGPLPTTPVNVTFQGLLGSTDVAALTGNAAGLTGTTPSVTITTTTPGVNGNITVAAAVAAKRWRVLGIVAVASAAATIQMKAVTAAIGGPITLNAGTPFMLGFNPTGWFQSATANEAFVIGTTGAATISGFASYVLF